MASNTKAGSEVLEANDRRVATAKKLVAFTQKNLDSRTKALEVWRNERRSQLKDMLRLEKELFLNASEEFLENAWKMLVKEDKSLIKALELARKEKEDAEAELKDAEAELKDAEKCRDKALKKWDVVVIDDEDD